MSWSVELWPGEITVNRDERQRRELSDIDSLAASIKLRGQLQPIASMSRNSTQRSFAQSNSKRT
jgi:ParB-like chromosome segregation protein Spo0J